MQITFFGFLTNWLPLLMRTYSLQVDGTLESEDVWFLFLAATDIEY
jgi:hypothetical protein